MWLQQRYQHIIWDWNGTLINDNQLTVQALNAVLESMGRNTVSLEKYRRDFEMPAAQYYTKLGIDPHQHDFELLSQHYVDVYTAHVLDCPLHQETKTVLRTLKEAGITQSILSAFEQQTLLGLLEYHGIHTFFDLVTAHNNSYGECKIEIGKKKLASLPIAPEKMLLVGDTLHDHAVALALKTDCVLLSHGHNSFERLQASGVPVFESMVDFFAWCH